VGLIFDFQSRFQGRIYFLGGLTRLESKQEVAFGNHNYVLLLEVFWMKQEVQIKIHEKKAKSKVKYSKKRY